MDDNSMGMESLSVGEQEITTIHKHPFGIAILYVEVIFAYVAAFGLIIFLLPEFGSDDLVARASSFVAISAVGIGALLVIFLLIATAIYRQSKLIITNRNLTQIIQIGLFNRNISELSMSNVEDVRADQRGIFASIFGFGTLMIETAGERDNFHFSFCPRPNYYGRVVLDARQRYVDGNPVAAKRSNERLNLPPTSPSAALPPSPPTSPVP